MEIITFLSSEKWIQQTVKILSSIPCMWCYNSRFTLADMNIHLLFVSRGSVVWMGMMALMVHLACQDMTEPRYVLTRFFSTLYTSVFSLSYPDKCQGYAKIDTLSLWIQHFPWLGVFLLALACSIQKLTICEPSLYSVEIRNWCGCCKRTSRV